MKEVDTICLYLYSHAYICIQITLIVVKRALEWLQRIQSYNLSKNDEQLLLVLQPYLSSSTERILRMQALLAISSSIKELANTMPDLFVLTSQDSEYLKLQLGHPTDFSSEGVLRLLLSLSCLSQNIGVMRSTDLLDSLSLIFEGDKNEEEQEIAAQLVQCIVEFDTSTKNVLEKEVYINSADDACTYGPTLDSLQVTMWY